MLRNIHFKLYCISTTIQTERMYVYVANSSPLLHTLTAVYSSAFNTWSRLESYSDCLSDPVIIKPDNSQQMSFYVRRILYTIYSKHAIAMWIYHNKNVMSIIYKHRVSPAVPCHCRVSKTKSEIVYNIANLHNICFTLKFCKFIFIQNIFVVVCFEVSPRPFGYRVAHGSWQEIHHFSSKWIKMCQSQ